MNDPDVTILLESLLKDAWSSPQLVPHLRSEEGGSRLLDALADGEGWAPLETPVKLRVLLAFLLLPDNAHHARLARLLRDAEEASDTAGRRDEWVPVVSALVRERLALAPGDGDASERLEARLAQTVAMLRAGARSDPAAAPYMHPLGSSTSRVRPAAARRSPKALFRNTHFAPRSAAPRRGRRRRPRQQQQPAAGAQPAAPGGGAARAGAAAAPRSGAARADGSQAAHARAASSVAAMRQPVRPLGGGARPGFGGGARPGAVGARARSAGATSARASRCSPSGRRSRPSGRPPR